MGDSDQTRKFLGSLIGRGDYLHPKIQDIEWSFSVKLEDGRIAYILSDAEELPRDYHCSVDSSIFKMLKGTKVRVKVRNLKDLPVIVHFEKATSEENQHCCFCEKLENFPHGDLNNDQNLVDFANVLKNDRVLHEFFPEKDRSSARMVCLKDVTLPFVSHASDSQVLLRCENCLAEWILFFRIERAGAGWKKIREGFRY